MTETTKKAPTGGAGARKPNKGLTALHEPVAATEPRAAGAAPVAKAPNKQQRLAALVIRDEGATLEQMIAATGWLPHTTRAALSGLKKKGYVISSDKVDGVRTYRAVAPE